MFADDPAMPRLSMRKTILSSCCVNRFLSADEIIKIDCERIAALFLNDKHITDNRSRLTGLTAHSHSS